MLEILLMEERWSQVEGSETKAHGNRFRPEVRALKAGLMRFGGVQLTIDVDDESRPSTDAWRYGPVCPKLYICWR